jgi:hypothetical protein
MVRIYHQKGLTYTLSSDDRMFFQGDVLTKIIDGRLEITRPTIDYQGKSKTPFRINGQKMAISITDPIMREGTFEIDEESDEDKLIIYLCKEN